MAEQELRKRGLRVTRQRQRILTALAQLEHATPDALAEHLAADGEATLALSTIYRNLEALTGAGVVAHSHLDHGAPSYHLMEHGDHLHLVCSRCGTVAEADPALAADLVRNLSAVHGFDANVTHMAIHGHCARCADSPQFSGEAR